MKTICYTLTFGLFVVLAACDIINPAEDIPAYVYVESFQVNTDSRSEGTNSSKIEEVWLSVNGNFLGAYTLPALIPILESGMRTLTLSAGIKDNGISATPEIYPFYDDYEVQLELRPNEVDTLRPIIGYRDNTRFAFIEQFETEDSHIFQDLRAGTTANRVQIVSEGGLEGNSAYVQLNEDNPLVELATLNAYRDLTTRGFVAYLEVDFRSDVIVVFGVQGFRNGVPGTPIFDPGFLPGATWSKIYFNLSPLVFGNNFDEFKILFQAILPNEDGVFIQKDANIWLDNIKLVHF